MSFQNNKPILRDRRTGQILKGSGGVPGAGRPNRRASRRILEELIGEGGEKAYKAILDIAEGRTSIEVLAREPKPHEDSISVSMIPTVRKVPSIRERLDAWTILAEHLNGKPPSSLDITVDDQREPERRPNYRTLSDADLSNLEQLLTKAKGATEEELIEGEIVEPLVPNVGSPPALPADTEDLGETIGEVSEAELAAIFS